MSRSKKRNNRKKQNNQVKKNAAKNVTLVSNTQTLRKTDIENRIAQKEEVKNPVEVEPSIQTNPVNPVDKEASKPISGKPETVIQQTTTPLPPKQTTEPKAAAEKPKQLPGAVIWLLNVLQIGVKGALLVALIVVSWVKLTPYFRMDRNKDGDYMRNMAENSIDVLALGSSHMQYAFNPGVFSAETGYYGYVFGSVCQPFSESYYLLKEVLKTQNPEVVIIDVFTLLPQSQVCYADGTYYIAMDMMSGDNRLEAADAIPDTVDEDTALGYKLDLYMNHGNWKNMDLDDTDAILKNGRPDSGISWELGYVAQEPEVFQYTPLIPLEPETVIALSENEKQWIDKIDALCREENIHLIFVKTPYIENQEDADKLAGIWEYLDSKGIEYVDYLQKAAELEWFLDMDGDTWHNNTWGAEIITKDLAHLIEEKGYVTRHNDNSDVEGIYSLAEVRTAGYLMNEKNINIYRLMEYGAKYPCTILFRYQGKGSSSIGEYENQALQALGLNHDFIGERNKNYYAVVQNGELLRESDQPFELQVGAKTITFTAADTLIDGEIIGSNEELQIVFCDNDFTWINPIGINYSNSAFWKNGCNGWSCTVE